jgi:hypothetical protein
MKPFAPKDLTERFLGEYIWNMAELLQEMIGQQSAMESIASTQIVKRGMDALMWRCMLIGAVCGSIITFTFTVAVMS